MIFSYYPDHPDLQFVGLLAKMTDEKGGKGFQSCNILQNSREIRWFALAGKAASKNQGDDAVP